MSGASLPGELITLVQVIAESAPLREWFDAVVKVDAGTRTTELARMAAEMRLGGEDEKLISAGNRSPSRASSPPLAPP